MHETEYRPDLNSDTPWSEMDLFDLANSLRLKDPIDESASELLGQSRREVREKIAELKAIEHIRSEMAGVTIEAFEADCRKNGRWRAASKSFPRPAVVDGRA
jgi:hypothetical protein